jgi:hypothetical protein
MKYRYRMISSAKLLGFLRFYKIEVAHHSVCLSVVKHVLTINGNVLLYSDF